MDNFEIIDTISELDLFFNNLVIPEEEKRRVVKAYDFLELKIATYEKALKAIVEDPDIDELNKAVIVAAKALEIE